ncbi:MAG: hypothetical protein KF760_26780 [Candidatus Eremiobacteraeota bacterium]|nr:hypothetical protein [Candidatus Eremiobacteraeota bacterium]MCW5868840.1 hypothetical protein [Candidatus Eremiobacteraeota bacterium]
MRSFGLQSRTFPEQLVPLPGFQALERLSIFLQKLKNAPPPEPEESRLLKEQLLAQAAIVESIPDIAYLSRQAQAAGLLCGALDGLRLYVEDKQVLDFVAPFSRWKESIAELTEVADQYWRGLDIESLHQQSVYARQENLKTESENVAVLADANPTRMRNQLSETFRIAYGMGLLDSALTFLFIKR